MSLPTSYLTSTKNLPGILDAIKNAQAPPKFTNSFLESLEYKSSSDRLIIGVLKALGFLAPGGEPTSRYFQFLDQTQSDKVLAEGIREAYADLFQVNVNAHTLSRTELKNKLKTLTQGKLTDTVLDKMAATFAALVPLADFSSPSKRKAADEVSATEEKKKHEGKEDEKDHAKGIKLGGLVYNVQIQLPESRDPAVYDALFKSLKEHLLK